MPSRKRNLSRRSSRNRDHFAEMLESLRAFSRNVLVRLGGLAMLLLSVWTIAALATFSISDPSFNTATPAPVQNLAGPMGAILADLLLQSIGAASFLAIAPLAIWGAIALWNGAPEETPAEFWRRLFLLPIAFAAAATAIAVAPAPVSWPYAAGPGGFIGDGLFSLVASGFAAVSIPFAGAITAGLFAAIALASYSIVCGLTRERAAAALWAIEDAYLYVREFIEARLEAFREDAEEEDDEKPVIGDLESFDDTDEEDEPALTAPLRRRNIIRKKNEQKKSRREKREAQPVLPVFSAGDYELPPLNLLSKPNTSRRAVISDEALEQNARMLENVLSDFGVRGEIINVRPGPVVTLYELEPAAGVKSSRVIGLADDIARSMSAVACRVAVVPGRNVIGIELPNMDREMVFLRELLGAGEYENSTWRPDTRAGQGHWWRAGVC